MTLRPAILQMTLIS